MQQHQSILGYKHGRYFKLAVLLCGAAIAAYAWHEPPLVYLKPYGGTWLGYTLGTVGSVLIVWLMLLGIRKRRYRGGIGTVQGWASAHVYLGISLLVIVTLHCAFEFGWNVHTLAYAFMVAVIVSGFWGLYAYFRFPELITKNLGNDTPETIRLKLADLDAKCRRIALDLPDNISAVVAGASRATPRELGAAGSLTLAPARIARRCPTARACVSLKRLGESLTGQQASLNQQLLTDMTRKKTLIDQVRRDIRYRALLELWLYFHVPLSFALLAALIAHVVSVFYFW
jgi:hypothetical protein